MLHRRRKCGVVGIDATLRYYAATVGNEVGAVVLLLMLMLMVLTMVADGARVICFLVVRDGKKNWVVRLE